MTLRIWVRSIPTRILYRLGLIKAVSIKGFGAKQNGKDCTENIQAAIDYVGSGTVTVPPGKHMITKPITLRGTIRGNTCSGQS